MEVVGTIILDSSAWLNTAAITSIDFAPAGALFVNTHHSHYTELRGNKWLQLMNR
jgi:hypothetical protein